MKALGPDGMLANYVTVTGVDAAGKSLSYTIQLVSVDAANIGGNNYAYTFDSAACDDLYGPVSGIDGTVSFQKGNNSSFYNSATGKYEGSAKLFINGSAGNDEIVVADALTGGSKIYASGDPAAGPLADDENRIILNNGVLNNGGGSIEVLSSGGELTSNTRVYVAGSTSSNRIDMGKGDVNLNNAGAANDSSALSALNKGKNFVTTEGDVNLHSVSNGRLLYATNGGVNEINVGGSGDVNFTTDIASGHFARAMFAEAGGENKISTTDGDINIALGNSWGSGSMILSYGNNSSNSLYAQNGKIVVDVQSSNGALTADGAGALISLKTGYDGVSSSDAAAGSISVSNPGSTLGVINNGGRLEVETQVGDISLSGGSIYTRGVGTTAKIIVKERGDITMNSSTTLLGGNDRFDVSTADGNITMHSTDSKQGYSLITASGANARVDIHSGKGDIDISGGGRTVDVWTQGKINLTADHGDIRLTSGSPLSNRQTVHNAGGEITLTAGDGNILVDTNIAANGTAAVNTWNSGTTNISASGEVALKAVATEGEAAGLRANASSANIISAQEDAPLTLTIDVTAKAAANAVAMWARGGGKNYVVGENGDNVITLRANDGAGVAMRTDGASENMITLGGGGSKIIIDGAIEGKGNSIEIGGDGNTVILNGKVGSDALVITPKDNGTFELVLQAADAATLNAQYGVWLAALADDSDFLSGLLKINLEGAFSVADLQTLYSDLYDVLSSFAAENVGIEINGENHSADFGAPVPFSAVVDFSAQDEDGSLASTNEGSGAVMFAALAQPLDGSSADQHGAVVSAGAGEDTSSQQSPFAESYELGAGDDTADGPLFFGSLDATTANAQDYDFDTPYGIADVAGLFAEDATLDGLFGGESAVAHDLAASQEGSTLEIMDLTNKTAIEEVRDIVGGGVEQDVLLPESKGPSTAEAESGMITAEDSARQIIELGQV